MESSQWLASTSLSIMCCSFGLSLEGSYGILTGRVFASSSSMLEATLRPAMLILWDGIFDEDEGVCAKTCMVRTATSDNTRQNRLGVHFIGIASVSRAAWPHRCIGDSCHVAIR